MVDPSQIRQKIKKRNDRIPGNETSAMAMGVQNESEKLK